MHYFFELGRQPILSRAEIEHVFFAQKIDYDIIVQDGPVLIVETKKAIDAPAIMHLLGGTIKIARGLAFDVTDAIITGYLDQNQLDGKIQFSLSPIHTKKQALAVKKELKALERSVRYIEPKNTATILHNNLVEKGTDLTIYKKQLFVTEAIQPIEELGKRDYDRPGRDSKSGMLPPKLAKIMLNLAIDTADKNIKILDPFCGSGTIIIEAMMMEYTNIIGSDITPKAATDTKNNIYWLAKEYEHITNEQCDQVQIVNHEVQSIDRVVSEKRIDAIVPEPYMGLPIRANDTKQMLETQANTLAELYKNAFVAFKKILKSNGTIVMIIPKFKQEEEWITIDCLPEIKKLGFEIVPLTYKEPSLLYHRENQFVGREIWKFKLTK